MRSRRPVLHGLLARLAFALGAVSLCLARPAAAAVVITGDHRLLQRFVEDGALVEKGWIEAAASYAGVSGGSDLALNAMAAFRFGRNVEAGFALGGLRRSRDAGERLFGSALAGSVEATGIADPRVYGKYRLLRTPVEVSVGAIASVPVADEERGLGPGSFEYRTFVGLRRNFPGASLVGNLGVGGHGDARGPGGAEGRSSGLLGLGVLVPLSYEWTFVAEVNYEGGRYAGEGQEAEAIAGLDWRPAENMVLRGGLGTGLSDSSPDVLAILSAAFHF